VDVNLFSARTELYSNKYGGNSSQKYVIPNASAHRLLLHVVLMQLVFLLLVAGKAQGQSHRPPVEFENPHVSSVPPGKFLGYYISNDRLLLHP
jgi:hypothetical protein